MERNAEWRGHRFYPAPSIIKLIPSLYGTESVPLGDKWLWLHYFVGACDWWLAEYDSASGVGWGYACLGDPGVAEWGYVSLVELESLNNGWVVERDRHWTPCTAMQAHLPGRAV
ncbi:hypothetical protein GCM10009814_14380 [Lapillicoccus jejuensis]